MKVAANYTLEVLMNSQQKYVFCVIKVEQREVRYFAQQEKPHITHRWLQPEHWAAFDSKIYELSESNRLKNLRRSLKIDLTDFVYLKIKKTKISIDLLCRSITNLEIAPSDVVAAIECNIKYQEKTTEHDDLSTSPLKGFLGVDSSIPQKEEQKDLPITKRSRNLDSILASPPKNSEEKSKENQDTSVKDITPENVLKNEADFNRHRKNKKRVDVKETSSIFSKEEENFPKTVAVLSETVDKHKKVRRSSSVSAKPSTLAVPKAFTHLSKYITKKKGSKRSASDDQGNHVKGEMSVKRCLRTTGNRVINHEEKETSVPKNVETEKASSNGLQLSNPQNSIQKKDDNLKMTQCHANNDMEKIKLLQGVTPKSPKKVKNLDLMHMSSTDIIKTFKQYEPQLEELFHKFKSIPKIKRQTDVDHFLVMGLLRNTTQLEMMKELSEHYEKSQNGIPEYGELFSMVLMPEWILRIFMKRYGMTRMEAISHIKAQNDCKAYEMDFSLLR